jgi:hypothetical protein
MEIAGISDALMSYHIPEATLALGGIFAVILTILYLKDRDSAKYKAMMVLGVLVGALMAAVAYNTYGLWSITTSVIMIIAAFTLIIRPFKDVHFALLLALMAMIIVYVLLGGLEGTMLEMLSGGWFRIGIAVFCGVMIFSLFHMLESVVKIAGKVMNAWPVLLVLGAVCIVEATFVIMGYGSVYGYMKELFAK